MSSHPLDQLEAGRQTPMQALQNIKIPSLTPESNSVLPTHVQPVEKDVTAILLNWKRFSSLKILIEHLCQQPFIKHVTIWNNNPSVFLTKQDLASLECPSLQLRIHNSVTNHLFLSRHLACASSSTPYCLHLDDEYLFWPVKSLYSAFKADPRHHPIVFAPSDMSTLYSDEWRFSNPQYNLDAQFAWLGYGSFVTKADSLQFLQGLSEYKTTLAGSELALADNYFTTSFNRPISIVEGSLIQLDNRAIGFSDGSSGLLRNKLHIDRGLNLLIEQLIGTKAPVTSAPSTLRPTFQSPCASDLCTFISNIPRLPITPASYPINLENGTLPLRDWEASRGHIGTSQLGYSNWTASEEVVALQRWAIKHPMSYAVDQDFGTAWISPMCEYCPSGEGFEIDVPR